jgi:oligoendopeptidase F
MNRIPSWTGRGIPALPPSGFEKEIAVLGAAVESLEKASAAGALPEEQLAAAVLKTDSARDLVRSLKTVCRARECLDITDTLAAGWLDDVRRLEDRLEAAAEGLAAMTAKLPEALKRRPPFAAWCLPLPGAVPRRSPVVSAVMLPLSLQHAHLTASMHLRVPGSDGLVHSMSSAQAAVVLKTSEDQRLRRAVFGLYSAWFAERAPVFADLLNAVLGWKLYEARLGGGDLIGRSLRAERISSEAYRALLEALRLRRAEARALIARRAAFLGQERLHVSQLLTPMPSGRAAGTESLFSFARTVDALCEATKPADPRFGAWLRNALANHWIDAQQSSKRAGGTWCEDMPAHRAVAIFTNYVPNIASAFQFAHPCGEGFLHCALHGMQGRLKAVPYAVTEIFTQLSETLLERGLARKLRGTGAEATLRWFSMARTSNQLLLTPSRHALLASLYRAREQGVLSVAALNAESRRAWDEAFADSVEGFEQYVWCWRPHFYRIGAAFCDWQYSFGYLVSQPLAERFLSEGKTLAGASLADMARDAVRMDLDQLLRKHLGADITKTDFWLGAADAALAHAQG